MSKSNNYNPFSLEGKTILITGASSGIGFQCAIDCSRSGARVIGVGRNEERLKEMSRLAGHETSYYKLELNDDTSISNLIDSLDNSNIKLNGIIHSAGISTTLPFKISSRAKTDIYYQTNVAGPLELTRLLLSQKGSLIDGASVIFLTSIMSTVGEVGKVIYSSTKGALLSAARSLSLEVARRNIRVNCVSPGVVKSPMSDNAVYAKDEDSLKKIESLHPLGLGRPEDVSHACLYLLSDASGWVTGSNLIIDGGYTAR